MKKLVIIGAAVIVGLLVLYFMLPQTHTGVREVVREAPQKTNADPAMPNIKLKADTFTGTLQTVDTGCFADGECFVEVDGKHITVLMGWTQETVGSVIGTDGIGGLEDHIGENVEVYAQDNSNGTYTLYGSEGFYIKVLGDNV